MNLTLIQAEKWLNELGIATAHTPMNTLAVNRRQMWDIAGDNDYVLSELKTAINCKRLFWESEGVNEGMECMFLGVF